MRRRCHRTTAAAVAALVVLLAACSAPPAPSAAPTSGAETTGGRPSPDTGPSPGTPVRLASLVMVDPDVGWATLEDGRVVRTTDGGVSWRLADPPDRTAPVVVLPTDRDQAVVVTSELPPAAARLWLTTDGGATWTAPPLPLTGAEDTWTVVGGTRPGRLWLLVEVGAAAGSRFHELFEVTDAGEVGLRADPSALPHRPATGIARGRSGAVITLEELTGGTEPLVATSTDGRRFEDQPLPAPAAGCDAYRTSHPVGLLGGRTVVLATCLGAGGVTAAAVVALPELDTHPLPIPATMLSGRGQDLWAASADGRVVVSHDEGRTWEAVTPPGVSGVLVAVDRRRAFVLGDALRVTEDGGATWHTVRPELLGP